MGSAASTKGQKHSIPEMQAIARELRRDIIQTIYTAGSGHPGGSLSELEILIALYFHVMNHDAANPRWPDRDRFILSKGHASPGFYAVLAKAGYFPREELATYRQLNSRIQGHAHPMTPGVEMNSGSLGMGLSFALGCALAARLDGKKYNVYALLGDGECDEGEIWEAAMSAAHHNATNLVAIVDRNRIQNDRFTDDVMRLEPLRRKWQDFGWRVYEIDGHSLDELVATLEKARRGRTKPTAIIANTVKGKGVSFMENNPGFHGRAPNAEEFAKAMEELA
ncbi:MAG: transketolase [Chloroflexi bacterium]|nr:transketolase [Chloroflexota bacterium]